MQKYLVKVVFPTLMLSAILMGCPAGALAQCGGNYGSMHDQHMGSSSQMGSGQMGMYGTQAPVQPDSYITTPGYVAPVPPPVSGYTVPQNSGDHGQMIGQGGAASGHSGHMDH